MELKRVNRILGQIKLIGHGWLSLNIRTPFYEKRLLEQNDTEYRPHSL